MRSTSGHNTCDRWEANFQADDISKCAMLNRLPLGRSVSVGRSEVKMTNRCPLSQLSNMSNAFSRACTWLVVFGGLGIGACASPLVPSTIPSGNQTQGAQPGQPSAGAVSSGPTASTLSTGANAGWTCLGPPDIPFGFVCAPPGLGLPSVPPVANYGGAPTYNLTAFTLDHQFIHRFKLLRPDLYHGEPCVGGDPWNYVDFLDYYECFIQE